MDKTITLAQFLRSQKLRISDIYVGADIAVTTTEKWSKISVDIYVPIPYEASPRKRKK